MLSASGWWAWSRALPSDSGLERNCQPLLVSSTPRARSHPAKNFALHLQNRLCRRKCQISATSAVVVPSCWAPLPTPGIVRHANEPRTSGNRRWLLDRHPRLTSPGNRQEKTVGSSNGTSAHTEPFSSIKLDEIIYRQPLLEFLIATRARSIKSATGDSAKAQASWIATEQSHDRTQ